jgi:hypothetical protein
MWFKIVIIILHGMDSTVPRFARRPAGAAHHDRVKRLRVELTIGAADS